MAEIFISEYIEGSSNNKAIELYNPTGVAIDLAAGTYQLEIYFNGNTTPNTTINLTGTIANDDIFTIADDDANLGVTTDQTNGSSFFNGNDAVVLKKNGTIIDAIGQIGFDPGNEWGSGLASTQNNTLRRKSNIVIGDTNPFDTFDPSLEWEGFAQDSFDGLSSHTGANVTKISAIQGFGSSSPLEGETVLIEAIATADFQGTNGLGGFFVQEEDPDIDISRQSSEGIFIYDGDAPEVDINIGDLVRVVGTVSESNDLTQLTNPNVTIISSGNTLPNAAIVDNLATANFESLEPYEGMQINLSETFTVSEYFQLGSFGQVTLSTNGRPTHFTHTNAPSVDGYDLHKILIDYSRIVLDDGSDRTSPNPIIFGRGGNLLSATNLLRGGDTVNGISGILDYRFDDYRVQTNSAVNFNPVNDRAATPPEVDGTLKVASFNLQNYFTTIDDGSNGARGADSADELIRQTDKLISAIATIDADIVGLMELENNGYGAGSAIQELVNSLNASVGAGTYDFVNPGLSQLGSDDIAVGFIYQPSKVNLIGSAETKIDGAFANFNRQPLVQTFEENATGEKFTLAVNHFKSKGSLTGLTQDNDLGDGQGNNNFTRTQAAQELSNWLATDPTNSNDPDFLIIGDLNAYAQEDPITTLKNAGYTNLIETFNGSDAYSFNFDGQLGYLDHALANENLTSQVTGVGEWHINADEPNVFDYNDTNISSLYQVNPFRSSDHDPVIIGLSLNLAPVLDNTGNPALAAINEDEINPDGTLVADLISGIFNDSNPNNLSGIAVTGVNNSDGDWEYSLDGITWNIFGSPSETNARLLPETASIRFLPASNFNGTVNSGITFRAWDGTSGSNGESADTSNFGGNTAFSVAEETAIIPVNPVNDAPIFVRGANQTVNQDAGTQAIYDWATNISAGGGVDEISQSLIFNLSNNNPALFAVQPAIDSNGTLSFTPAANGEGSAVVSIALTDDGGTANGGVDTSVVRTFTIAVNPVAADEVTDNSAADNSAADEVTDNLTADEVTDNSAADEVTDNLTADEVTDNLTADEVTDNLIADEVTDNLIADEVTDNLTADNLTADNELFPRPPLDRDFVSPSHPLPIANNVEVILRDYIPTSSVGDGIHESLYSMDRLYNGENNLDDNMTGEGLNEAIAPLGGNDFIRGMEGFDYIEGGDGNDTLNGNQQNDFVNGGLGHDSLHGGKNNDTVNGATGNDIVRGDLGDDILDGWQDNDFLNGNQGNDWVDGGSGDDILHGGKDDDTLIGGTGNDRLFGDFGNDLLIGGSGEDIFGLDIGRGSDAIADFTDNIDKIGLAGGLTSDELTILSSNNHTVIKFEEELLATLYNIDVNQIASDDFMLLG